MNCKLLISICFFISLSSIAQVDDVYSKHVRIADSLYKMKEYAKSAENYYLAFESIDRKAYPNDRYNAACSYALAGEVDSSFFHLFRLAESSVKYSNYNHIINDTDLQSLQTDDRWKNLIELVEANKLELEKNYDKPLVAQLDSIYQEDQKYRRELQGIEEEFGRDSDELKNHWKIIQEKDSLNLIKVQAILDTRGWLGSDVVGPQGNAALFLVIQHSTLEIQEKYLPMMRTAVEKGNASGSSLALLEDRVALGKGEMQVYGSQIGRNTETGDYYVLPLADPENVDQRRASVGLSPIQDYVQNWGLTWDIEAYKKELPAIIEWNKK